MHSSASHIYILEEIYKSASFTTSGNAYLAITTYSRDSLATMLKLARLN